MRILIIGAGVAGLTLAALLRQRGETPVIIERDASLASHGYMLGLYPLGGRVLHGLGLHPEYMARSTTMRAYTIGTTRGQLLRKYSLAQITRRHGPIQGIGRDALVKLLLEAVDDAQIRTGTTVTGLTRHDDVVEVEFSDGSAGSFDLVVAADGMHSDTRSQILAADEFAYRDTGWGGWVFCAEPESAPAHEFPEHWGAGRFPRLYPARGRVGVSAGGLTHGLTEHGHATA